MEDKGLKKFTDDLFQSAKKARQKYELRWYIADNFYENNHFVKAVNQLGQLEPVKFPKGIQVRPIPRAKKQLNSQINLTLQNNPRWTIYPRFDITDQNRATFEKRVKRIGNWFDDLWYYLHVKDQIRKLVSNSYRYNVGYAEIGGDNNGNIFLDVYDPYDIWHESGISHLKETSFLIKGVSRTLQYVRDAKKSDGEYLYDPEKTAKLKTENRLAISDWKNIRLQEKGKGAVQMIEDPRVGRVFLKEIWFKDGEYWNLVTECQGEILRNDKTEYKDLPFVSLKPQEGLLYQPSPFEDLIPMNKAIDILTALVEGYTRTTAIGRYLKNKNSKLKRLLNEHGEIVEYEGMIAPTAMPVPPLPSSVFSALNLYVNFMDEIGTSVVTFGKVPSGVKAYKALESLKNSEFSNLQTSISLLESTLEEIAEKIIDLADSYFTKPVTIYHLNNGKPDYFKLISANNSAEAENSTSDAIPIDSKYTVKVEIENGISYTEEGKRESYMALADKGYLPKEEVLKAFKFSNAGEIIEEMEREKARKTSIVESAEFGMLPPETRIKILKDLGVNIGEDVNAKISLNNILGNNQGENL